MEAFNNDACLNPGTMSSGCMSEQCSKMPSCCPKAKLNPAVKSASQRARGEGQGTEEGKQIIVVYRADREAESDHVVVTVNGFGLFFLLKLS